MTTINGSPTNNPIVPEPEPLALSDFGPKRVKTKEMEIEQFDPMTLERLAERRTSTLPCFGTGATCVGRYKDE